MNYIIKKPDPCQHPFLRYDEWEFIKEIDGDSQRFLYFQCPKCQHEEVEIIPKGAGYGEDEPQPQDVHEDEDLATESEQPTNDTEMVQQEETSSARVVITQSEAKKMAEVATAKAGIPAQNTEAISKSENAIYDSIVHENVAVTATSAYEAENISAMVAEQTATAIAETADQAIELAQVQKISLPIEAINQESRSVPNIKAVEYIKYESIKPIAEDNIAVKEAPISQPIAKKQQSIRPSLEALHDDEIPASELEQQSIEQEQTSPADNNSEPIKSQAGLNEATIAKMSHDIKSAETSIDTNTDPSNFESLLAEAESIINTPVEDGSFPDIVTQAEQIISEHMNAPSLATSFAGENPTSSYGENSISLNGDTPNTTSSMQSTPESSSDSSIMTPAPSFVTVGSSSGGDSGGSSSGGGGD